MNRFQKAFALSVASLVSTGTLIAPPAHAAARAGCPVPSRAEVKRSDESTPDQPPKGGRAIEGVRVTHLPSGFVVGQVITSELDDVSEYGYQWTDARSDASPRQRFLGVRVICAPDVQTLSQLKRSPFDIGGFSGHLRTATLGGRKVLVQDSFGAVGRGKYIGWLHREGVVVTVMASESLVHELGRIVRGIELEGESRRPFLRDEERESDRGRGLTRVRPGLRDDASHDRADRSAEGGRAFGMTRADRERAAEAARSFGMRRADRERDGGAQPGRR
ncbi:MULTISPECIES: hypothetical protein [Nonomuraea]|uniref:Uncharacterized protein n=1 Tax=Nonomuraea mangrovi TaxID=2316207 RepID=A0ABW4T118_9ACTN